MPKTFLYTLFGVGKIPREQNASLQSEGIVLLDEGISASVTYLDFRSPGRRANWKRQWFTGSIALSRARLFAMQYSRKAIDVPVTDERFPKLRFSVEGEALVVAFDAGLFHCDWSGTIEYRFKTSQASAFLEKLNSGLT